MKNRYLVLDDGSVWEGKAFGGNDFKIGEIVSHRAMSGYQEIISDSSYDQQIIIMNFPLIGAVGINHEDFESITPTIFGLVIKELSIEGSNFRNEVSLAQFMESKKIAGICDVDTRALSKRLQKGDIKCASMCDDLTHVSDLVKKLQKYHVDKESVKRCSTLKPFPIPHRGKRVVIVDLGVRFSALRTFSECGYDVLVVPYNTCADDLMALHPDIVVYSHGGGGVEQLTDCAEQLKIIMNQVPIFAEGLGSLLLAKVCGSTIIPCPVKIHSSSTPIRSSIDQSCTFVSAHQDYLIDLASFDQKAFKVIYEYVSDSNIAAFTHKKLPIAGICFLIDSSPIKNIALSIIDGFLNINGGTTHE